MFFNVITMLTNQIVCYQHLIKLKSEIFRKDIGLRFSTEYLSRILRRQLLYSFEFKREMEDELKKIEVDENKL